MAKRKRTKGQTTIY